MTWLQALTASPAPQKQTKAPAVPKKPKAHPHDCKCGRRGMCKFTRNRGRHLCRRFYCVCGEQWLTYELRREIQ